MAHSKIIQAIRIYLTTVETENAALGIYTSGGSSEIRLSEEVLSGVAETWTSGLIAKDGISERGEGADLTQGGAVADYTGMTVDLIHTNQYLLDLAAIGVYLQGCNCKLYEFIGSETDNDSVSSNCIFTGIIEDMQWSETNLGIPIKNAMYKRNAPMSAPLIEGSSDIIPITFGKLYPEDATTINNIAKFVRQLNTKDDTVFTNDYFTGTRDDLKIFPCYSVVSNTQFNILVSGIMDATTLVPTDCYCVINSGTGRNQIRQVTAFIGDGITSVVTVTVSSVWFYTQTTVPGDTEVPSHLADDTRSWVQFLQIKRDFVCDNWKCFGFLKSSDGTVTTSPELYSYVDDKFNRIADFGFKIKSSTNKNALEIDGEQYSEDVDKVQSFVILPCNDIGLVDDATLDDYGISGYISTVSKHQDGIYTDQSAEFTAHIAITNALINNGTKYNDKDFNSYSDFSPIYTHTSTSPIMNFIHALWFGLPKIPDGLDVKNIYVGIKATTDPGVACEIAIAFKRFAYSKTNDVVLYTKSFDVSATIENLPDRYYEANIPSTNSLKFYRKNETVGGGLTSDLSGYQNFILTGITQQEYSAYDDLGLFITGLMPDVGILQLSTRIFEMAIIFELNESTIGKEIYPPASGRVYDSTWGTRRTATNLIVDVPDIIEHADRLQDFSETGETGIEWGKEYATSALIKTGAGIVGSFDNTTLTAARVFRPAFQIFDAAKAWTGQLKKDLCQTYNLCSRIDESGYECIYPLIATSPSETLTFAHLNGDVGEVVEPKVQDVFCEPLVNYCYNAGSDKLEKQISIKNISAYVKGVNWASCSSGFANLADAESVLDLAYAFWLKFKSVEKTPSWFTDQRTVTTYADALGYLLLKLSWMGKQRISFPTFYLTYQALSLTQQFFAFQHINLNLPHQTDGAAKECIIENVSCNKNSNFCKLDLVIL